MHEKEMYRKYYLELFGSLFLYAAVLVPALHYGKDLPAGILKTDVMVLPMIPALLCVWAIARHFGRMDEYLRLQTLETLGISFGVTAVATFTYGFLENAGFPQLTMFYVWPLMGFVWLFVGCARSLIEKKTNRDQ